MNHLSTRHAPPHVEAFCSTGSSPGRLDGSAPRCGRIEVRLHTDHGDPRSFVVRFEDHGPTKARPVVVLGGISSGRHIAPTPERPDAGWWGGVVGAGCALDPRRHRLIGIDYITREGDAAPEAVTSHDQARAIAGLLDDLGLDRCSLVGASYGGMVALAFAECFPDRIDQLAVLCAAHRTHPMATAQRVIQRALTRFGVRRGDPKAGLALGRALAMTTYRSAQEFEERFESEATAGPDGLRFPVEDYLEARAGDFARNFTPARFIALSESIDLHRTHPASVPAGSMFLSVDTDALVPSWLVDELIQRCGVDAHHVVLSSSFGHDAFLKERRFVSRFIDIALAESEAVQ